MRRDTILLALGAIAVLATTSAHVRVETPRKRIAIEVAMHGISVTVRNARLDCMHDKVFAGCPVKKPAKPLPV